MPFNRSSRWDQRPRWHFQESRKLTKIPSLVFRQGLLLARRLRLGASKLAQQLIERGRMVRYKGNLILSSACNLRQAVSAIIALLFRLTSKGDGNVVESNKKVVESVNGKSYAQ